MRLLACKPRGSRIIRLPRFFVLMQYCRAVYHDQGNGLPSGYHLFTIPGRLLPEGNTCTFNPLLSIK